MVQSKRNSICLFFPRYSSKYSLCWGYALRALPRFSPNTRTRTCISVLFARAGSPKSAREGTSIYLQTSLNTNFDFWVPRRRKVGLGKKIEGHRRRSRRYSSTIARLIDTKGKAKKAGQGG